MVSLICYQAFSHGWRSICGCDVTSPETGGRGMDLSHVSPAIHSCHTAPGCAAARSSRLTGSVTSQAGSGRGALRKPPAPTGRQVALSGGAEIGSARQPVTGRRDTSGTYFHCQESHNQQHRNCVTSIDESILTIAGFVSRYFGPYISWVPFLYFPKRKKTGTL